MQEKKCLTLKVSWGRTSRPPAWFMGLLARCPLCFHIEGGNSSYSTSVPLKPRTKRYNMWAKLITPGSYVFVHRSSKSQQMISKCQTITENLIFFNSHCCCCYLIHIFSVQFVSFIKYFSLYFHFFCSFLKGLVCSCLLHLLSLPRDFWLCAFHIFLFTASPPSAS